MQADDHKDGSGNDSDGKTNLPPILGYVAAVTIATWLFNTTLPGLITFLGDDPAFQVYPWVVALLCVFAVSSWHLVAHRNKSPVLFMVAAISWCIVFVFASRAVEAKREAVARPMPPVVMPARVHLHTGKAAINNIVQVKNPNSFDLFHVQVLFQIEGEIGGDSLKFDFDAPPMAGAFAMDGMRMNGFDPKSGKTTSMLFLAVIPANGTRRLQISGTLPVKSSADLSIMHFTNSFDVFEIETTNGLPEKLDLGR